MQMGVDMKKILLIILALNSWAFAATPTVICDVRAQGVDARGLTLDIENFTSPKITPKKALKDKKLTLLKQDMILSSSMKKICATDGGPCSSNYKFYLNLKLNNLETEGSLVLHSNVKNELLHLSLKADKIKIFMNCLEE
jgi:hypothetical protein